MKTSKSKPSIKESIINDHKDNKPNKADNKSISTDWKDFVLPEFREFDVLEHYEKAKNLSCAIFGRRRLGKTTVVKHLLSVTRKWYAEAYVFFGTADVQKDAYDYVPEKHIYNGIDVDALEEIYETQKTYVIKALEEKPARMSESEYKAKLDHIVLIFDDVITDPAFRNNQTMKKLFTESRHLCMAVYVIC